MAFFNKPKEPEMLQSPKYDKSILSSPPTTIPEPPKMFKEDTEQEKQAVIDGIVEKLNLIIENQEIMNNNLEAVFNILKVEDKDLQLIPDEDKETYLALKQTNPKMAEKLLKEYKSDKK